MSWAGPAEELESTCEESEELESTCEDCTAPEGAGEEQALEGTGEEQALEGAGEEQALGLGSKPSPHNPLTSPGAPGGAQVARNWTEPAETKTSWAGPEKMSREGPAETKISWTGPAETKMSWTGPAETKMSWVGPAETLVGWFRLGTGNFPTPVDPLSPTQSCGVWEIHRALVICPEPKQMEDCHVGELRHRGEPAEFPGELHEGEIPPAKGEGCRRRTPSPWRRICLIFPSLEVGYSVTVLHGEPGTRRRGLQQTGVLMDEERRRYRNTGKDINISVDIYNNRQETRGRTDY